MLLSFKMEKGQGWGGVVDKKLNVMLDVSFVLVLPNTHKSVIKMLLETENLLQELLVNRAASTQMTHLHDF